MSATIYHCIVPEDKPTFGRYVWKELNELATVKDGMFLYTNIHINSYRGIYIPIKGEEITYKKEGGFHVYKFSPSNMRISITGVDNNALLDIMIGKFHLTFMDFYHQMGNADENPIVIKIKSYFDKIIEEREGRQSGREMTSLKEINSIPDNVKGIIGDYLVGERGNVKNNGTRKKLSLASHIDKQKQRLGYSLAPRARGGRRCSS